MATAEKYDVKKDFSALYAPPRTDFVEVDVPELAFLMVDGHGDPNSAPEYVAAVEALFAVSYAVKFAAKKELGRDHVVGPLEGLWSAPDPAAFVTRDKSAWDWTMMIAQPHWITTALVTDAIASVTKKAAAKGAELSALGLLRLDRLTEGRSVQILHVGSYDDEAPTLARLHDEYLPAHGLRFNGRHHEIYLSDARRTEPAKLKTVLRQPVAAVAD